MFAMILYWAGILLIVCAVGYFIAGMVRKEPLTKQSLILLALGIVAFIIRWFVLKY